MPKRLTLTFDNGPWPGATEQLLDFLAARNLKATFFVVGRQLEESAARGLAERARAEGHWIGNHTMTHGAPLGNEDGRARYAEEIGAAQEALGELAHPRKFFRPNGSGAMGQHLLCPEAVDYLRCNNYTVVTWTSAPGDWRPPHTHWTLGAFEALDRDDWTVLVLHDRFIAPQLDVLGRFCDRAQELDVEFVQDFPARCMPIENGHVHDITEEISALA
ncbi:putative xylanase/chitin deacetylase [Roseovarius mucosus DSM 17069]|uniref:Chitooligosaccharide deacetylase n=1 Tax=Roseovarius mucosus DSM 17069 TaxID=1288298 RepID=A0A0A0HFL0_9RHOB|nr:polysaccharide deacetylase family protein [Roseovarius mucosus]KGM85915.1 putative xylanase/chitin deacetylase [Roseovarius mucosus DSM 17069]